MLLLRHAHTLFNKALDSLKKVPSITEEDEISTKSAEELRDAMLTTTGHKQCAKAEPIGHLMKVHTIFVSPYRRALQTVHEIFKNHPEFHEIRFVLLPLLREFLNWTHDIPVNIDEVINQYKQIFDHFDTSALDNYEDRLHYFIEDLDQDTRQEITEKLEEKEDDPLKSNAFDIIIEMFKKNYPTPVESVRSIWNRWEKAREKIQELLDSGEVRDDEKVIVCGHSTLFKVWTNKFDWETEGDGPLPKPENFIWLKNWEFLPDDEHFPRKILNLEEEEADIFK